MRISDWSSDVCSSDLGRCGWRAPANARLALRLEPRLDTKVEAPPADVVIAVEVRPPPGNHVAVGGEGADPVEQIVDAALEPDLGSAEVEIIGGADRRSEEHTSELQSLMRISYAVFCLKKKIKEY